MSLCHIPLDIYETVLQFLPLFDVHNLWQINKEQIQLKSQTKERYHFDHATHTKFLRSLSIFKTIDVLDTTNRWCEATIIGHQIYKNVINIKVKYMGYSSNWNEWIRADNNRIAEHGSQCYNGTNEPKTNDRIIYYHRNRWRDLTFISIDRPNNSITLRYRSTDPPITITYIPTFIAPISRRAILMS